MTKNLIQPLFELISNTYINEITIRKLKKSINVEMIIVLIIFFLTSLLTTSLTLPMSD